jgi:mannonate dehydratase
MARDCCAVSIWPPKTQPQRIMSKNTSSHAMERREFARVIATGVIGAGLVGPVAAAQSAVASKPRGPRKNTLHRVGGDYHCVMGDHWASKKNFDFHQRCGVTSFSPDLDRDNGSNSDWKLDDMKRWKDACDKAGMTWDGIRMNSRYIYLKPGAERDRRIESIIGNIRKASQVGVKLISHHWTMIPIRRNTRTPGRGGATYAAFKLEDNWKALPVESNGIVSADDYWERITHFLTKVMPVCAEVDVRMAVHPYDPPGLPRGYQGTDNWNAAPISVLDSLKKYEAIVDSPYNGFQLCLGTCGEGLRNMRAEILPIVQYLADKGKIHQVHMRNVRGGLHDFQEVYHDEGDMNFLEVIRILRDAGYAGTYLPDHAPTHPDDPGKFQAFAFAFGYIKALIHAANSEVPA